jgi:4-hydroxy-tetrahydrodipicolinate synthase
MITPFDDNFKIDLDAYHILIEWYLNHNVGGLYANCLSSEMYQLSPEEQLLLITEAVKMVNGRVPVAATGNSGKSIKEHVEFSKQVAGQGADIVMLLVPDFLNEDNELLDYYLTMAENIDAPLGLYECPVPRPYHLSIGLIEKLANTGKFVAYKETSCDLAKIKKIIQLTTDTPLAFLQANIPYLHAAIRAGSPGSMNIASIWAPDLVAAVIEKSKNNDPEAKRLHGDLVAMEMVQRAVHPRGSKYLLQKRGLPVASRIRAGRKELEPEERYALDILAEKWFTRDLNFKTLEE